MSEPDRIRVPTNGHRAPLSDDAAPDAVAADTESVPDGALTPADLRIAFSPGQLAAGFGILAGLILLVVGSRRRGKRG